MRAELWGESSDCLDARLRCVFLLTPARQHQHSSSNGERWSPPSLQSQCHTTVEAHSLGMSSGKGVGDMEKNFSLNALLREPLIFIATWIAEITGLDSNISRKENVMLALVVQLSEKTSSGFSYGWDDTHCSGWWLLWFSYHKTITYFLKEIHLVIRLDFSLFSVVSFSLSEDLSREGRV